MKKMLLNGVDGNFSSRTAAVLLDKWPHEDLIFTAPTEKGLERFQGTGVDLRVADFKVPIREARTKAPYPLIRMVT